MKKLSIVLLFALTVISSCTKNFEEINTDTTRPNPASSDANSLFGAAVSNGLMRAFEMQRVQALYPDLYSQYFATSAVYFPTDRYGYNTTWLEAGWNLIFPRDINNLITIMNSPAALPEQKAVARIWKVFLLHRYVDIYGDIPYFNVGYSNKPQVFDAQKDIYYDFFKELDESYNILNTSTSGAAYNNQDPIYGGTGATNVALWKKFANSLRLRLAIRISTKDPAKAKTEGEKAILLGTFAANTDNAFARVSAQAPNPLNQISGFGEFRMSATMESLLLGYSDPRLPQYFSVVTDATAALTKPYNGAANGLLPAQLTGSNTNATLSNVGPRFLGTSQATNPIIVLTYAEVCFNKSEAALLGWNVGTGTDEQWYNLGIAASMNQFGITNTTAIAAYQNDIVSLPVIPDGLTRATSTLPIKYATVTASKTEQISIQRWLATYPDGFEGWSNFRRTGFPKLFPVANLESTSDVAPGAFVQRIPYPDAVRSLSNAEVVKASARMGSDKQATKLWFAGGN
jgi:Susd and RagB outer membrane lipoprotein